jgi:hypothetical protein
MERLSDGALKGMERLSMVLSKMERLRLVLSKLERLGLRRSAQIFEHCYHL